MKKLMTGNEALARGAYEAGVIYASAYPGTPSTEILENLAQHKDLVAEWAPNEKVALEAAFGASMAGVRSLAAMKHVGVNVAADPLMTIGYTGVTGGFVLVSADDPGCHSSQNEQDNRYYAKFAKIPCVEPSTPQECLDFMAEAYKISESYDTAVLVRMTTRVCHSKGLVKRGIRKEAQVIPYVRQPGKYIANPGNAKKLHPIVEERLLKLAEYSEISPLNVLEAYGNQLGIITAGVSYSYVKEVFGESADILKLGFSFPLPMKKIERFIHSHNTVYVVEELEPFMEEQIKAAGLKVIGKELLSNIGEFNPDIIREKLLGEVAQSIKPNPELLIGRPPILCAGCPHRGFFYELGKRRNVIITGDIGCYTLGGAPPINATDSVICMGASISMGHGAKKALEMVGSEQKVVAVIGDSTFLHSGMTSLLNAVYNNSNTVNVILDNRVTAMTGHQQNPGTGFTLQEDPAAQVDLEAIVRALGIKKVLKVNPLMLEETRSAIKEALDYQEGPCVIITRWPCAIKKFSQQDLEEFELDRPHCRVVRDLCRGCKNCIRTGCPCISFDPVAKKAYIDETMCVGCTVCLQSCPFDAIERVGE
ncbi:MAG: indolepyruvate ferredoxin oxidoreductase subunit alpha [Tissierellia bacterium]|nr:indolepyruvate ferredoxin oxidoreductase subunit alpha [Tissierellia bacterium]